MGRVANNIRLYLQYTHATLGYTNNGISVHTRGILSAAAIAHEIDNGDPIIAGISPNGMAFPPGLGISDHAVVIEGYNGNPADGSFTVIVNDPFPYSRLRWLSVGASELTPGQYEITYAMFVLNMKYANSITFD
jgi:hypothetical protein